MMILATNAWAHISEALSLIAIFAAMPTLIVWICLMARNQMFDKKIEMAKIAVEKDPSLNLQDFLTKSAPTKKTYAQKSISYVLVSCICLFLGLGASAMAIVFKLQDIEDGFAFFGMGACVLLGCGLAFLVSFFYVKKLIRKGILK